MKSSGKPSRSQYFSTFGLFPRPPGSTTPLKWRVKPWTSQGFEKTTVNRCEENESFGIFSSQKRSNQTSPKFGSDVFRVSKFGSNLHFDKFCSDADFPRNLTKGYWYPKWRHFFWSRRFIFETIMFGTTPSIYVFSFQNPAFLQTSFEKIDPTIDSSSGGNHRWWSADQQNSILYSCLCHPEAFHYKWSSSMYPAKTDSSAVMFFWCQKNMA